MLYGRLFIKLKNINFKFRSVDNQFICEISLVACNHDPYQSSTPLSCATFTFQTF